MIISMIAAVSRNGVIGRQNDLPWRLPDDMKYFMETTKGHTVIMGRKNYESIPEKFKPLPNRQNIVVTRQVNYQAFNCRIVHSFEQAMALAAEIEPSETFIIGGSDIYKAGLSMAQRLYVTEIQASIDGDVYFPVIEPDEWQETSRIPHAKDSRHAYAFDFVIYARKQVT